MKLEHWPLMRGLLHGTVMRRLGGAAARPCRPLLTVPNVTAHLSTASVSITVLLYNAPLLCGFDVPVNGN